MNRYSGSKVLYLGARRWSVCLCACSCWSITFWCTMVFWTWWTTCPVAFCPPATPWCPTTPSCLRTTPTSRTVRGTPSSGQRGMLFCFQTAHIWSVSRHLLAFTQWSAQFRAQLFEPVQLCVGWERGRHLKEIEENRRLLEVVACCERSCALLYLSPRGRRHHRQWVIK